MACLRKTCQKPEIIDAETNWIKTEYQNEKATRKLDNFYVLIWRAGIPLLGIHVKKSRKKWVTKLQKKINFNKDAKTAKKGVGN